MKKEKIRKWTTYSSKTGLEIRTSEKKRDENDFGEGRVAMRFFIMSEKNRGFRFLLEPWECHELFIKGSKVIRDADDKGKAREQLDQPHKTTVDKEGVKEEILTNVNFEKYRNGKGDDCFAVVYKRGKDITINVPVGKYQFYFILEYLKFLGLQQAWCEEPVKSVE